jgi:hypothetical protein
LGALNSKNEVTISCPRMVVATDPGNLDRGFAMRAASSTRTIRRARALGLSFAAALVAAALLVASLPGAAQASRSAAATIPFRSPSA